MMTPSYMEWYRAAMANGGVVPAAGTPLQVVSQHEFAVPVVVPVNLMPGGEGMSPPGVTDMGYGGYDPHAMAAGSYAPAGAYGVPPPMMMMGAPAPPGAYGEYAYAAMTAAQHEYYAAMHNAHHYDHYGYVMPPYMGSGFVPGGRGYGRRSPGGRGGRVGGRGGRGRGEQWRNGVHVNGGIVGGRFYGASGRYFGDGRANEKAVPYTVFVKDVPASVSERELADVFASCGRIIDCRMCGDANTHKFSYAFVAFECAEAVDRALLLDKTPLHGKNIMVKKSDTAVIPVNPLLLPQNEREVESCARTIYVANVDKTVDSHALKLLFEDRAGPVNRLHLQVKNNAVANVAFVEFVDLESVGTALHLTGEQLGNRMIRVSASKTPLRLHRRTNHGSAASTSGDSSAESQRATMPPFPYPYSTSTRTIGDEPTTPESPPCKVYVRNIPKTLSPGSLRAMFSECGQVRHVELLTNPKSKFPYAFIDFEDNEAVKRALDLDGKEVDDCQLKVEISHSKKRALTRPLDPVAQEKADRTVYVTDIDPEIEPTLVRDKFEEECGKVALFWYKAFEKGEKQAIAFIEFAELSSVGKALKLCRTHFLCDSRLVKVRHSVTALTPKEGHPGTCHTPELDSPASSSGDECPDDRESVVRNLSSPLDAEIVAAKVEKLGMKNAAA